MGNSNSRANFTIQLLSLPEDVNAMIRLDYKNYRAGTFIHTKRLSKKRYYHHHRQRILDSFFNPDNVLLKAVVGDKLVAYIIVKAPNKYPNKDKLSGQTKSKLSLSEEREIQGSINERIRHFGPNYETRLWQVAALVTNEHDNDIRSQQETELLSKGFSLAEAKEYVDSDGVYIVTTQLLQMIGKAGFWLVNQEHLSSSLYQTGWFMRYFMRYMVEGPPE